MDRTPHAGIALVLVAGLGGWSAATWSEETSDTTGAAGPAAPENAAPVPDTVPVNPETEEAADAGPTTAGGQSSNRFVSEIIVTAQKREENLQDVPISVSAFSAELLDAKGITNPTDLPLVTPGLTYTSLVSYSIIYIRGVGTDAFVPSFDMSVPTYIDGILMPYASGLAQSFGSVERIEVLKGPQGTLFGRNSTGGAISIITRKPNLSDVESSADVSYGRYDDLQSKAHLSIPLSDELAFSVSGLYNRKDPYYDSVNQELDIEVSRGVRGKLRWAPTDDLDLIFGAMRTESSGTGSALSPNFDPKPPVTALGYTPPPDYTSFNNDPSFSVNSTVMYNLDGTWKLPWFNTRLILADQTILANTSLDFDGTQFPLVSFQHPKGFSDMQTGELQVLSNDESWGSDWLTYIGGVYYLESSAGYDPLELYPGVRELGDLPGIGPTIGAQLDTLRTQFGVLPGNPITVVSRGIVDTESLAFFFQGTAAVTDWFSVTAGGRYQKEDRALVTSTVGTPENPDAVQFPLQSTKTTNFSPKLSLDFRPADDLLVYGSYSKGFKSGSYNIVNIYTASNYVRPEEVTSIEIGAKTEIFDRSVRLNGAIFQNEIKDLHVQIISLTSGGAVALENAGEAKIKGAEFDLTWQPGFAAAPGLVVSLGGTYLDAKYEKFDEGSGYDEETGAFFGPRSLTSAATPGRDFAGNRINQTPEFTGTASLGYSWEMEQGVFEAGGDFYYNSGFFFSAQNSPHSEQKRYHVINARISYLYEPWGTRITVFGRNLDDQKYYLYQFETDFGTLGLLQPEAAWGARLSWEFN